MYPTEDVFGQMLVSNFSSSEKIVTSKNIQAPTTEIFSVRNNVAQEIMKRLFDPKKVYMTFAIILF